MKSTLVRLMAIAILTTSVSFAAENNAKRTESAPNTDSMQQQEKAAKKARRAEQEKKQKENATQQSSDPTLNIWG